MGSWLLCVRCLLLRSLKPCAKIQGHVRVHKALRKTTSDRLRPHEALVEQLILCGEFLGFQTEETRNRHDGSTASSRGEDVSVSHLENLLHARCFSESYVHSAAFETSSSLWGKIFTSRMSKPEKCEIRPQELSSSREK